jgi:hypothetical protein
LAIYSLLLIRVQRLARYPRPSRFLTMSVQADPSQGSRTAEVRQ